MRPPSRVDPIDHPLPARQRGLAVEERNAGVVAGGRPVDHRALGEDQPDVALGAAPVIGRDVVARHAFRREGAGHRRHDDAVLQGERFHAEGLEQGVDVRGIHGIGSGAVG